MLCGSFKWDKDYEIKIKKLKSLPECGCFGNKSGLNPLQCINFSKNRYNLADSKGVRENVNRNNPSFIDR